MSTNYDFRTLSPEDFERLIRDLLGAQWGVRIESFKQGRDKGIDLRHTIPESNEQTIIQCKHYSPDAFARLKRHLQNEELPKIKKLAPSRYVLVTSIPLSVANKDDLLSLLKPWCKSTADIIGAGDINGLLIAHPAILKAHFKLWLSGTEVLEKVLHAGIWNISADTLDDLRRELCRLVVHNGFQDALNILHAHHHCLIVGIPGIGKTTLAKILLWYYIQEGFEAIVVSHDIQEAWNVLTNAIHNQERVAILYDDFLGQVNFEAQKLEKNEDKRLIQLLELTKKTPNIRFILTTREYILEDAKKQYAILAQADLSIEKFTLTLQRYTRANRARILFNHLYFSNLPISRLEGIVKSGVYKEIIGHQNYSPRIVRVICEHATYSSLDNESYIRKISQQFDNPMEIWDHAFCHDIRNASKVLLYVLWTFGQETTLSALSSAFSCMPQSGLSPVPLESFELAVRELDGNFIRTERMEGMRGKKPELIVYFHNPSIRDYLERKVESEPHLLQWLISGCVRFSQVEELFSHIECIEESKRKKFVDALIDKAIVLVESPREKAILFGGTKRISYDHNEILSQRLGVILALGIAANKRDETKQAIWPWIAHKDGWAKQRSAWNTAGSANLFELITGTDLLSPQETLTANAALRSHLLDVAEDAFWLSELNQVATAVTQHPDLFNDEDKAWLSNKAEILADQVLSNLNDLSVDAIEDERFCLQECAAQLNFDARYWEDRFDAAISKAEEMQPEAEDIDERKIAPHLEEQIDIDGLFAELLNR
jgi:hypothetical protein